VNLVSGLFSIDIEKEEGSVSDKGPPRLVTGHPFVIAERIASLDVDFAAA
jgi:hypothetical protein